MILGRGIWLIPRCQHFRLGDIPRNVQQHLRRVYTVLAFGSLAYALGIAAQLAIPLNGVLVLLTTFGGVISLGVLERQAQNQNHAVLQTGPPGPFPSWVWSRRRTPANRNLRLGVFVAVAACMGISSGNLVAAALSIRPLLLLQAALAAAITFGCFTVSALTSPRRSWLFLSGTISTVLTSFLMLQFTSWWVSRDPVRGTKPPILA